MLDAIVDKYNIVHRSIKMKPIDIIFDSDAECNKDSVEKDPKLKVGDHIRISKYQNVFDKVCSQNWSEENLLSLAKLKINFHRNMLLAI